MEKELEMLGLTKNEIKIYLELLKSPNSTATFVRTHTKIANSRVYSALDSLIDLGVVNFKITHRGKLFSAEKPEIISQIAREQIAKIEKIIPYLKKIEKEEKSMTESVIYKGFNGFKTAFYKSIEDAPEKEEIL